MYCYPFCKTAAFLYASGGSFVAPKNCEHFFLCPQKKWIFSHNKLFSMVGVGVVDDAAPKKHGDVRLTVNNYDWI